MSDAINATSSVAANGIIGSAAIWLANSKTDRKTTTNSAGDEVEREFVDGQDELLEEAEREAGGSLDNYDNFKPGWWQSPDGKRKIEWNPDGHVSTNEGPHVTVREYNGRRFSAKRKIFIRGQEKYRR